MVNAFSFCLYGPENPRYYPGMLENVELIRVYFPDWKVYVYYAPDVTEGIIESLKSSSNVVLRPTGETGAINMIYRFYAIDEPGVDTMMVRDADSRVHWKDRWAIREFISSDYNAHTIRDNKEHTSKMMGGLWGIRKSMGINIQAEYLRYKDNAVEKLLGHDQDFLNECIYPKIRRTLLVHYSNNRAILGEIAIEFPFEWSNDVYCGRIEYEYLDIRQPTAKSQLLGFLPKAFVRIRDAVPQTPVKESVLVTNLTTSLHMKEPSGPLLNFLNKK
jgi:hypothetical protein